MIHNFSDYLAKVNSIEWGTGKDLLLSGEGLTSKCGNWKLGYRIEEANNYHDIDSMPLQVVVHVLYKGQVVSTWGTVSNEENSQFVKFMQEKRRDLNRIKHEEEKEMRKAGQNLWNEL